MAKESKLMFGDGILCPTCKVKITEGVSSVRIEGKELCIDCANDKLNLDYFNENGDLIQVFVSSFWDKNKNDFKEYILCGEGDTISIFFIGGRNPFPPSGNFIEGEITLRSWSQRIFDAHDPFIFTAGQRNTLFTTILCWHSKDKQPLTSLIRLPLSSGQTELELDTLISFEGEALESITQDTYDYYTDSLGFRTSKKNWSKGLNLI